MTATPAPALEEYRRFYADEIAAVAGIRSQALSEAFATVPREDFLGPGPWKLCSVDFGMSPAPRYVSTPDADPRRIYHNVLVSIDETRHLNNGQPSALAAWLDALDIQEGERVVHVGAGIGYYTAILAEVAGAGGSVVAIEVDEALAARARTNLAGWKTVQVVPGDGSQHDPGPVDVIFVNAGVTHPCSLWLDRLKPGGRLLYPLTFDAGGGGKGCMLLVRREAESYSVKCVGFVMIYSCTNLRDADLNESVTKQISSGKIFAVKSLRRDMHQAGDTCLVHAKDSCLSSKAI
ncbi:MAG TPA: rRNA adenine N-6-methyltransferase family protein [Bryobacteraceae bacterium]|nr:rRNA adenine N-6-methyltransferase family protein [Bryobacteraceae bacterium]